MFNNVEYLPWSGRRYKVSIIGDLYDSLDNKVATLSKNDHLYVNIEWILGKREYNLASIILFTFGLVKLPEHLFDEIIPLYKDNSSTNLTPVNLLYKFRSGKLPVEDYPDFYYIPFFSDYAINERGDLINIKTGKFKSWSVTKPNPEKNTSGGYLYSRVVNEEGFSKCLFQHRAICLVFKDYNSNVNTLVVNHLDGNTSNNKPDNLEFTTHLLNNLHAVEIGLRRDNKPILCKNLKTGEELKFQSVTSAGRYFNQPRAGFISHRLRFNPTKVYSDMLVFKYDDGKPWPEFDTSKLYRTGNNEDYVARNVFTGDLTLFKSTSEGLALFNVKGETILNHVRNRTLIPVNGWNFRYSEDNIQWPNHTERHLKIYAKYPIYPTDGVICLDIETNTEIFFESVAICCQKFKFDKRLLYRFIKLKKIYNNKYLFKLFDIRKTLGPPIE